MKPTTRVTKFVKRILFSASRLQEESFKQKKFVISYNFIGNVVVVVLKNPKTRLKANMVNLIMTFLLAKKGRS